jgi:hypothetical protein
MTKAKPLFGFGAQTPQHLVAESQRRHLREAADRIERGESLEGLTPELIAVALRGFADRIPDAPRKGRGTPVKKLDPAGLELRFRALISGKRMTKAAAIANLAELSGASIEAITKALKKRFQTGLI